MCNHVLYTALGAVAPNARAGFVYLPWSRGSASEGAPGFPDEDLALTVRLVVDHALDDEREEAGGNIW